MARRATPLYRQFDFSGGVQSSTSRLLRKENELSKAVNGSLGYRVGAVSRRLGQVLFGTVQSGKDGLGGFVHRYSSGSRLFAATNDAGDTATVLKYFNGTNFTVLGGTSYAAGTKFSGVNYLDELYLTGYSLSTDTFATTANIDSTLSYSTTRNVNFAPRAKNIIEYNGRLYASNVEIYQNGVWTRYPDRIYVSSYALGAVTYVQGDQLGALNTIKVDTVKYLKVGQVIDIYQAGTETQRLGNVTITAVSKNPNNYTISFAAPYSTTASANAGTDVITVGSTTNFPTGTPIVFGSTGNVPAGLTAGTVYYAINQSSTTLKVATSSANATAGTAVDITDAGTGTLTINVGYVFTDNDEIWVSGRKGKLSVLWNTDFPNYETADFIRIPAGQDENSAILAMYKITNRLFFFTSNSFSKWDGTNLTVMSSAVGCAAAEAVKQVGTWMIFPHTSGIWAFNDNSGQLKLISRGIADWVSTIPAANFTDMSAGTFKNQYKLSIGYIATYKGDAINGYVRLVYDFDMNNWMPEVHTRQMKFQFQYIIGGILGPVFQDNFGNIVQDNIGNTDLDASLAPTAIPFSFTLGANNYGQDELKGYSHTYAYCESNRQGELFYSVDGGPFKSLGQLDKRINKFEFNTTTEGRDIDYTIMQSDTGDPLIFEGLSTHYQSTEANYG